MKRAVFVSVGTIAGLTATLRYTPDNPILNSGTELALGSDTQITTDQTSAPKSVVTPKVPNAVPSKEPAAKTPISQKPTKKPTPKPTKKPKPKPTATKKPKPKPTPKKTSTPKPTVGQTFTGVGEWAAGYGIVQVKITVLNGKMTAITPISWPTGGTSSMISGYAIPLLEKDALASQSSNVATIGGATYTSAAFRATLASAMANAGL